MGRLNIETLVLGAVSTNCYLLINEETKETIIVDPAALASKIENRIEMLGLKPVAILLTHGHFDHILAAHELRTTYRVSIYALKEEEELLGSPDLNLSSSFGEQVNLKGDHYLGDQDEINLAGFSVKVLHTPGHTSGSACYYIKKEGVLISGDTLFEASIGRTDFPTGNSQALINSIKEKLFVLPGETMVYPGHGNPTQIEYEEKNNPYV